MAGYPVVFVEAGGLPVTYGSDGNGWPIEEAASGLPVTIVASGGLPVVEGVGVLTDLQIGKNLHKLGLVLQRGGSGEFDEGLIESPNVQWDSSVGKYRMLYVGYNAAVTVAQIGSALADGPEGPFTKDGSPYFTPSGIGASVDEIGVSGPVRFVHDGTEWLFYIGLTSAGYESGTKRLCLASRPWPAGGAWTRHGAIVSPQGSGWAALSIWRTTRPIWRNGHWTIFFNASDASNVERIGYATTAGADLTGTWTVSADAVIGVDGTGWRSAIVGDPADYSDSAYVYMKIYGAQTTTLYQSDGLARTTWAEFPDGWVVDAASPILVPSETYEGGVAAKPGVLLVGADHYHYYRAGDPANANIALAKSAVGPQNFLTNGSDFSNAAWTKSGVTVVTDIEATPDGDLADRIVPSTGNVSHRIGQLRSVSARAGVRHKFVVDVKASGYGFARIFVFKGGLSPSAGGFFDVDLSDGSIDTVATAFSGWTNPVAAVESLGNGWYRCSITVTGTASSATTYGGIGVLNAANNEAFVGDGTSGVLAARARTEVVTGAI